jgi:transcriptional regulator with XRE-family HTH domain
MRNPVAPTGLRKARLLKGWPIGALAAAVNVAESTLYRIEQGLIKEPRQEIRRALAKVLKVKEADLFKAGKK